MLASPQKSGRGLYGPFVPSTIMLRLVFPNVINAVLIIISLLVGQTILLEASLSFLGVGVPPGEPAWGRGFQKTEPTLLTFGGCRLSLDWPSL